MFLKGNEPRHHKGWSQVIFTGDVPLLSSRPGCVAITCKAVEIMDAGVSWVAVQEF